MRIQSMRLCRFNQRVQIRVGFHASYRLGEEIVLATDNEGPDGVLCPVVVDRIAAVFNESFTPWCSNQADSVFVRHPLSCPNLFR